MLNSPLVPPVARAGNGESSMAAKHRYMQNRPALCKAECEVEYKVLISKALQLMGGGILRYRFSEGHSGEG